jgi:hypothetical protein
MKRTGRELREAFGVRGACSRFRSAPPESASKLDALETLRDFEPPGPFMHKPCRVREPAGGSVQGYYRLALN